MRPRGVFSMLAGLAVLVALAASPAAAVAGAGCPAWGNPGGNPGQRDGQLLGIDAAVEAVGVPREQVDADRTAAISAADKNGDGLVCVAEAWGTELNPNSHWARYWGDLLNPPETSRFSVSDNRTGTSKG